MAKGACFVSEAVVSIHCLLSTAGFSLAEISLLICLAHGNGAWQDWNLLPYLVRHPLIMPWGAVQVNNTLNVCEEESARLNI